MTRQERQRFSILIVLLAVLGLTLLLAYRMNSPATAASIQAQETTASANPLPAASDARIRLDIVDTQEDSAEDVGRKDLFRYRQAPPPPAQTPKPGTSVAIPPPAVTPPPGQRGSAPQQPSPSPPPIPLQYQGFAVDKSPEGGYIAFLAEGTSKHYNVRVGEVLMGRYRIARISDTSVEVEDLEYNRRQTLPVLK